MSIQPHKSFFQVRGILVGKLNPKFMREGNLPNNGTPYKSVNFGIKTSPEQIVYVEKFGTKNDKAYAYNRSEKKTLELVWDTRNNTLPSGYKLIMPDWDIANKVINDFEDGDSVIVNGELDFQEYNDNINVKQIVKNIYKTTSPVDFELEGFEEESIFTQEITVNTIEYNKEEKKIYLTAYIFKGKGKNKPINITPAVFVIYPDNNKKFANNIMKLKYGDTLKVDGIIHSRLEKQEVVADDEWGTTHSVGTRTRKEYEIVGVYPDTVQSKLYKEEDIQEGFNALQPEKLFGNDDSINELFGEDNSNDDLPFKLE